MNLHSIIRFTNMVEHNQLFFFLKNLSQHDPND